MMDTDLRIEKKKRVPSLRFAGFDGEWEVKRLGSVADIIMGQSPAGNSYNTTGVGTALINGPVEFTEKYPIKTKWTSRPTKLCQNKDILFCVRGSTTGKMNIADGIYCIGRGVAAIRANKKSTSEFIEFLIVKNLTQILALTSGSTFFNLDSKSLKEYIISFPTLPEQQKIASFLTAVDEKLQALKQQKNLLEQYKKGIMQRIFSQEIRFKDDEGKAFGEWGMKKLGEVLFEHKKRNEKGKIAEVFSVAKNKGVINQIEHLGRSYASKITSNYKVVFPYDIVYTKSPTSDFPFGVIKQNKLERTGIVSVLYAVFSPVNKDLGFLLDYYFSNPINTFNYLNPLVQKGAKNTMNINNDDFLYGATILLPPSEKEQTKIAHFLSAIDEKISHCQVHITKMEQYKKGLLQQLFV